MRKRCYTVASLLFFAPLLAIAAPPSALNCTPCVDRGRVRIVAIPHGAKSDAYWLQVQRAALVAANQLKIDLEFFLWDREDSTAMAEKIKQEADTYPDALIATINKPDKLREALLYAAARIPVFTFNSGYDIAKDMGATAHIGMHEYNAGFFAIDDGFNKVAANRGITVTGCLYITHFTGGANQARRNGFKKTCEDNGLTFFEPDLNICKDNGLDGCLLSVSSIDTAREQTQEIYDSLGWNTAEGLALLCGGADSADPVIKTLGGSSHIIIGSVDTNTFLYESLQAGTLGFAVSQNQWLQGYLPILVAAMYVSTGQLMAPEVYMTGPDYILEALTEEQTGRAGEAFPICDCPWTPTGDETTVECEGAEAIGPCVTSNAIAGCVVPCFDARTVRIAGVTHGREDDSFWFVVKAGAEQAARDLRLIGFYMDLWKKSEYSEENMAQRIRDVASSGEYDAMFVTVPGPKVQDAITFAVEQGVTVATVNSGDDVSKSLGTLTHVGMPERFAGQNAGKKLMELGVTHVLCPIHELQNGGLDARCDGVEDFAATTDGAFKVTIENLPKVGIDILNNDDVKDYFTNKLTADTSINGVIFVGGGVAVPVVRAPGYTLKPFADRGLIAGTFDDSGDIQNQIADKENTLLYFSISQQQYMQGYWGVIALWLYKVTGAKLADHLMGTGPYFVERKETEKAQCMGQLWSDVVDTCTPELACKATEAVVGQTNLDRMNYDFEFAQGFPVCQFKPPQDCNAGYYLNNENDCSPCAPGTNMALEVHQQRSCTPCPRNTYSPLPGMAKCWSCPAGSSTAGENSASCIMSLPCRARGEDEIAKDCIERESLRVIAVVHGQTSDLFWLRVKRAILTAVYFMKINKDREVDAPDKIVRLQVRNNLDQMADVITQTVEGFRPDALLVTIPGPGTDNKLFNAIEDAAQKTNVFSLNSGLTDFLRLGSKAHFSMDETLGGYQAAGKFQKAFIDRGTSMAACIVVNHEVGNSALDQRMEGYRTACAEQGLLWLAPVEVSGSNVDEHTAAITQIIDDYLASTPAGGIGILLLGQATSQGAAKAYNSKNKADLEAVVMIGSFDVSEDTYNGISSGALLFCIDQNEWLQGYLSVVIATLYISTGNLMAPKVYPTGPSFIFTVPSAEFTEKASEAFPVCDCPWGGGLEETLVCTPSVGLAVGKCPLEGDNCVVPCKDSRTFKIAGVTHAHEADTFWFVVKAGAEQAANDLRLIGFEMDLFGPPGKDRSDAFTEELFTNTILETADRADIDAMFISVHGSYVYDAITTASSKKVVVTINSGYDVSEGLNGGHLIGHVGMHEFYAGRDSGKMLAEAGGTHILCIVHELEAAALEARCAGAEAHVLSVGKRFTKVNLPESGVVMDDDDAIKSFVEQYLTGEASIDAILCCGGVLVDPVKRALLGLGKEKGAFFAGSFDTNDVLVQAINDKEYFLFGVDQQQYMQGYMGVMAAFMYLLTKQRLASHVIESGPYFIRGSEPDKDFCTALNWESDVVGERLKPSMDATQTVGFPVCEYTGNCKSVSEYFDLEAAKCKPCPAGKFKNSTLISCNDCEPGQSTNNEPGSTMCIACATGKYAPTNGTEDCIFCERGRYQPNKSMEMCHSCEAPLTTENIAQESSDACVCPEEMFYAEKSATCENCKEGMTCPVGSDSRNLPTGPVADWKELQKTAPFPEVDEGYMTLSGDPLSVYQCTDYKWCPGGPPNKCASERFDVGCAICPDTMMAEGVDCVDCPDGLMFMAFALPVFIMFFAPVGFYYVANDPITTNATTILGGSIAVGLLITVIQVLGTFGSLSVRWPESYGDMLGGMKVFLFEPNTLKMECVFGSDPFDLYMVRFILPYIAAFMFIVQWVNFNVFAMLGNCVKPWNINKSFNSLGHALQTVFIALVGVAVLPMQCYSHPNGKKSVSFFPSVICGDSEHTGILVLGLILVCTTVIPYFGLNVYATISAPRWEASISEDHAGEKASSAMLRFRYLFYRFRPDVWWWGNIVNSRQLMLAFAPMIQPDDPGVQVIYVLSILIAYLILVSLCKPWKAYELNAMEILSLFFLSLIIVNVGSFLPASPFSASHEASMWVFFAFTCLVNFIILSLAVGSLAFKGLRGGFGIRYPFRKTQERLAQEVIELSHIITSLDIPVFVQLVQEMSDFDRLALDSVVSLCINLGLYTGEMKPNSALSRIWSLNARDSGSGQAAITATYIKQKIQEAVTHANSASGRASTDSVKYEQVPPASAVEATYVAAPVVEEKNVDQQKLIDEALFAEANRMSKEIPEESSRIQPKGKTTSMQKHN